MKTILKNVLIQLSEINTEAIEIEIEVKMKLKNKTFSKVIMELVDYVDGDNQLYLLYSEFNLTFLLPYASTFYILYFRVAIFEFIIQKYCSF